MKKQWIFLTALGTGMIIGVLLGELKINQLKRKLISLHAERQELERRIDQGHKTDGTV